MVIAVAGLWELGHNVPLSEAGLWYHPMRDFAVDEWHMTPITGIHCSFKLIEHETVEDMINSVREHFNLVFVSETADVELKAFAHPGNACYVFGKANYSPFNNMPQAGDHAVRIDTTENKGRLWPHQAMAVVLWHRRLQWP